MGRGWKVAWTAVVLVVSLLAINTLLVDRETGSAEVAAPEGRIPEGA